MSYHGSGIDAETYETLRAYMFGQELPTTGWSKEDLKHPEEFIDWIFEMFDWQADLPGYTEEDVREMALAVFNHEVAECLEDEEVEE